jgi:radical SAM protein with 4Fe4S-binding SPASM domain
VNKGIIPSILFTPLHTNYKKLVDMVDILYSLGIRKILFNTLKSTGRGKKIYKDIMLDFFQDREELQKIVDNIRGKYTDFTISNPGGSYRNYPLRYAENRFSLSGKSKQKLMACTAGLSACCITAGGWVVPCSELFALKGGNIREQDIMDIWRDSESFKKIRELSDISMDQVPYCRNCDYNVFCSAGCRASAYAIYGDLQAPDPFCPYWRER